MSSDGMMSEGDIGSSLHSMLSLIFVGSSVLKVMLLNISKLICCLMLSMVNNWLSSKKETLSGAVRWSGEVGTPGDEDPEKLGGGVRVLERGVVEGVVEFDTGPETRMSLNLEFLMLALNLLSIVDFRLRLEVLIGVLLWRV